MTPRVWDRFLTAQDRELSRRFPAQRWGLGGSAALLVIDMYRRVFGDRAEPLLEAVETWPGSCGEVAWQALGYTQELIRAARVAAIPVVHTTGSVEIPPWAESRWQSDPAVDRVRAEGYEVMPEVAPIDGEPLLKKAAPSAFWGTPLAGYLNQRNVDTLLVAGESTSGCVRASVVDARSYRYRVAVVEECVFDRTEAAHAINLFDMEQKYADVIGLSAALEYCEALRNSDVAVDAVERKDGRNGDADKREESARKERT